MSPQTESGRSWLAPLLLVVVLGLLIPLSLRWRAGGGLSDSSQPAAPQFSPLAAGDELRVLVAETEPGGSRSVVWSAPVSDPEDRQELASLSHRSGYQPQGLIAPDGQKVALLVVPPTATEQGARINANQVWIAGEQAVLAAEGLGYLVAWTPDSAALIALRYVPLENPSHPDIPFRTELVRVPAGGGEAELVFSDQTAYGITPLGWAAAGQLLYVSFELDGSTRIMARDLDRQQSELVAELPQPGVWQDFSLAPDGSRLAATQVNGNQATTYWLDLTRRPAALQNLASALPTEAGGSPFSAVWDAEGHLKVYHTGALQSQPVQPGPATGPRFVRVTVNGYPLDTSPDGDWLVWQDWDQPQEMRLERQADGTMTPLEPNQPGGLVTWIGWLAP